MNRSGHDFLYYREQHHPGKKYLPIIRVISGARQDSYFEGSLQIYDGRVDMLAFTNECLLSIENLLQRSLSIVLESMEVIAHPRVASILHLSVIWLLRWLAGKTHKLAHCQWGELSMGKAIDLFYEAFVKIEADGLLILDHEFMINIFSPLYE